MLVLGAADDGFVSNAEVRATARAYRTEPEFFRHGPQHDARTRMGRRRRTNPRVAADPRPGGRTAVGITRARVVTAPKSVGMLHFTAAAATGLAASRTRTVGRDRRGAVSMQPVSTVGVARRRAAMTTAPLRGWQRRALVKYLAAQPRDFLAVATPGSGKTTFALRVAAELLSQRAVEQITVVVPTEHLKVQWAQAAQTARPCPGPEILQHQPADLAGVPRRDGHLRPGRVASDAAPGAHRAAQDPGHLRRDPPRR